MTAASLNLSSSELTDPIITTTPSLNFAAARNATRPLEQYRFIPGSTPTFRNDTVIAPTLKEPTFNGTGYYMEDGEIGEIAPGLNEIQTIFLACIATLIPLMVILGTGFAIRMLWKRFRLRQNCTYDGVVHCDSKSNDKQLLNIDKLSESHHIGEICDIEISYGVKGTIAPHQNNETTNGSIITMTLKNNHLIVETEERNDIEEESRETTMKYSTGARDGVFVVEVQQGGRRQGSNALNNRTGNECAQIHPQTERYDDNEIHNIDINQRLESSSQLSDNEQSHVPCKSGLSQSDQSLTTCSYTYGNQQAYDMGLYGYPAYAGYDHDDTQLRIPDPTKPKIMSAIYKNQESFDQIDYDNLDFVDEDQKEQIRLGNEID